jgi:hypothetical protein
MSKVRFGVLLGVIAAAFFALSASSAFGAAVTCHVDAAGGAANGDACLFTEGVEKKRKPKHSLAKSWGTRRSKWPGFPRSNVKSRKPKAN